MTQGQVFVKSDEIQWEDMGGGLFRQILGNDPGLMMVRVKFRKGGVGAMHSHPHRQVSYIESGSFEVVIDGEKQALKAATVFICRRMRSMGRLHWRTAPSWMPSFQREKIS